MVPMEKVQGQHDSDRTIRWDSEQCAHVPEE